MTNVNLYVQSSRFQIKCNERLLLFVRGFRKLPMIKNKKLLGEEQLCKPKINYDSEILAYSNFHKQKKKKERNVIGLRN